MEVQTYLWWPVVSKGLQLPTETEDNCVLYFFCIEALGEKQHGCERVSLTSYVNRLVLYMEVHFPSDFPQRAACLAPRAEASEATCR